MDDNTLKFQIKIDPTGLKAFGSQANQTFSSVNRNINQTFGQSNRELKQMATNLKAIHQLLEQVNKAGGFGGGGGGRGGFGFGGGGFFAFLGNAALFSVMHRVMYGLINTIQSVATGLVDAGIAAVQMAGNFEKTILALSVATGSARLAREEIKAVDEVSRNTTGLRLESAEQGYTRLRNLGFAAKTSRDLLKGLATQKIISGADESAINRVIVNLTQLSAGSIRASQDIKEIILAMPSLRNVFQNAFGTLNPSAISAAFKANPDEAVNKLSKAMAEAKAPARGLNESVDKLTDAGIQLGRAFGEPILAPLTTGVQLLTQTMNNSQDIVKQWGEDMAALVGSASLFVAAMNGLPPGSNANQGKTSGFFLPDSATGAIFNAVVTGGAAMAFGANHPQTSIADFAKNNPITLRNIAKTGVVDMSALSDTEVLAKQFAAQQREIALREAARQKELTDRENTFKIETQLAKDAYAQQEALLKAHHARNKVEEAAQVRNIAQMKRAFLNSEIGRLGNYYDKQIEVAGTNEQEVEKLTYEKFKAISEINRDLAINSIETQAKLKQIEAEALEERRKLQIEYNDIEIQIAKSKYDNIVQEINRGVERGNIQISQGMSQLRDLENNHYAEQLAALRNNLALQLQEEGLTAERIRNIKESEFAAEQQLTIDHRQRLLAIDDQYYQEQTAAFKRNMEEIRDLTQSRIGVFGALGSLFSGNFNSGSGSVVGNVLGVTQFRAEKARLKGVVDFRGRLLNSDVDDRDFAEAQAESVKKALANTNDPAQRTKLFDALSKAQRDADIANFNAISHSDWFNEASAELDKLVKSMLPNFEKLTDLADAAAQGVAGSFDQIDKVILQSRQDLEKADLDSEIGMTRDLLKLAQEAKNKVDEVTYGRKLKALEDTQTSQKIRHQAEQIELYSNSLDGLNEAINRLSQNDKGVVGKVLDSAAKDAARERKALLEGNIKLEYDLAHIGEDSAARYRRAWLEAIYDVKNASIEAAASQIKSQVKIADQTTFHADRARAGILEAMSGAKGYTEIFQDAFLGVNDAIGGAIDGLFDKVTASLGAFGKVIADIGASLLKMVTNRLMMKLLDAILPTGNGNASIGIGGGGGQGGFNIGSIIPAIFGGGGSRGGFFGGTPSFNPNGGGGNPFMSPALGAMLGLGGGNFFGSNLSSTITSGDTISGKLFGQSLDPAKFLGLQSTNLGMANPTGQAGGLLGGLFGGASFGGLLKGLGQMAPLLGLSLGAGLGGQSVGGQILGSIGGLAGGLALGIGTGAIGASGGIMGGLVGALGGTLAATGIFAAVAAPLLIGAYILGRNKRRREEEKIRNSQVIDTMGQLDQILKDTKAHKYSSGEEAIEAANQVRKAYVDNMNQLKDKKTKRHAMNELPGRIDPKINEIKAAAGMVDAARKHFDDLIPEFATGGIVPGQIGSPRLVLAHGGEIIANLRQQTPALINAAADAGIPGVRGNGGGSSSNGAPVYVEVRLGKEMQNELFVNGAKSQTGFRVLVDQNKKARDYERTDF